MKKIYKTVLAGLVLGLASFLLYGLHYKLFHDLHHILVYFVGDIAFIPIEVLIITLIIDRVIEGREKRKQLEKLNMVIGVFFSEIGDDILEIFVKRDESLKEIKDYFAINVTWKKSDYKRSEKALEDFKYRLSLTNRCFVELREFLISKREFLLKLIENPILLEHERFTDLLMAIFHLEEELIKRKDLENIKGNDRDHIVGDIKRVYLNLFIQWLQYARYLQNDYPYLFSFLVRKNPFSDKQSIELK